MGYIRYWGLEVPSRGPLLIKPLEPWYGKGLKNYKYSGPMFLL